MPYLHYILCFIFLYSCGRNKPKDNNTQLAAPAIKTEEVRYVNSIKLTSPGKNEKYSFNDEINIAFENKNRFPTDSAQIFINGEKIAVTGKDRQSYTYRLPEMKAGHTTIKVIAWHPENKQGVATSNILVKPDTPPQKYSYEIVKTFPHDPKAYTQGLVYHNGFMYEGTGQYGESSIRKSDMAHGSVLSVLNIDSQYFGEGVTIYNGKVYQITWKSRKGFVYDLETFTLESTFNYNSQGWGITTAGDKLIMSDGSNKLYHISPSDFNIIKEIEVYDNNGEVVNLNELEYVNGLVWANVWLSDRIVAVDPQTGVVKGELDMSNLLSKADKNKINDKDDVLNGIAYNPEKKTFYLTGKRWPKLFEVKINTPNL